MTRRKYERWEDFIERAKSKGYKVGLEYTYQYEDWKPMKQALLYNPMLGVALWISSYWTTEEINGIEVPFEYASSGHMYAFAKNTADENIVREAICWMTSSEAPVYYENGEQKRKEFVAISFTITNSWVPFEEFEKINEKIGLATIWPHKPFLWFIDFNEEHTCLVNPNSHREISQKKIEQCPEDFKTMVGKV